MGNTSEILEVVEDKLIQLDALADMVSNIDLSIASGEMKKNTIHEVGNLMCDLITTARDYLADAMSNCNKAEEEEND